MTSEGSSDAATDGPQDATAANAPAVAQVDPAAELDRRLAERRAQVAEMNERLAGWRFEIPAYKFANVDKTLEDMLEPVE